MKLLRALGIGLILLTVGALAGAATAWATVGKGEREGGEGPSSWRTSLNLGSSKTDALQRAILARTGIWALPASEVIYYSADTDSEGRPFSRACDYEIVGRGDPPTRWWSISLYRDNFWVDNPGDRYSFSKTTVTRTEDSRWRIHLSARPQAGDWLPMGPKDGKFLLSYRLYQPEPSIAADLKGAPLPPVRRLSCV